MYVSCSHRKNAFLYFFKNCKQKQENNQKQEVIIIMVRNFYNELKLRFRIYHNKLSV